MHVFSRKWPAKFFIPIGMLIAAASYGYAVSQHTILTPIQELEAGVEPYQLKFIAETNRQGRISIPAEQREILVSPAWAHVELNSFRGPTKWNVSVIGWDGRLQAALLDALNNSPASAKQLVEHRDERIQFLLLKVLSDWGHDIRSTDADFRNTKPWNLKPHAIEALLTLAHRNDPLTVGTVISALLFKGKFSTDVFLAGMAHNSSDIRSQALVWMRPERQQLSTAEIQAVAPVLINHLTDRDLYVRIRSIDGLQSLVAYWEQSRGGAPSDVVHTDQTKMIKLPIAPASDRWYRDVLRQSSETAEQYQAEWKAWLTEAEESL
jgi:hypothetical protein